MWNHKRINERVQTANMFKTSHPPYVIHFLNPQNNIDAIGLPNTSFEKLCPILLKLGVLAPSKVS